MSMGPGRDLLDDGQSLAVRRFRGRLLGGLGLVPVKAKRALVLGCGDGSEAAFLAALGYKVDAYDLQPHPAWAAVLAAHKGRVRFRTADVAALGALKQPYDLVLQKDMLHHVPDPASVLRHMKRLTKPGGRLIVLECNRLNPISYLHLTLLKGHEHFTPWRLRALLDEAGLQDAVISRREARVWPVESDGFQGVMDKVQDLVERVPGLRELAVYNIADWVRPIWAGSNLAGEGLRTLVRPGGWRVSWIELLLLVAVLALIAGRIPHRQTPVTKAQVSVPGGVAASLTGTTAVMTPMSAGKGTAAWGRPVTLRLMSKFKVNGQFTDMRVGPDDTVYLVGKDGVEAYRNGRPWKSLDLKLGGKGRSIELLGDSIFITQAEVGHIHKVKADLSSAQTIVVKDARFMHGIGHVNGELYVADVVHHWIYRLSPKGVLLGTIKSQEPNRIGLRFVVSIQQVPGSRKFVVVDHLSRVIGEWSGSGEQLRTWSGPWGELSSERIAFSHGNLYVNAVKERSLYIGDLQGRPVAYCQNVSDGTWLDEPTMISASPDGYLYIANKGEVLKLFPYGRPRPTPTPTPSPAFDAPSTGEGQPITSTTEAAL
jgi:SAM-dependent methyltransferase